MTTPQFIEPKAFCCNSDIENQHESSIQLQKLANLNYRYNDKVNSIEEEKV